MTQHVFVGFGFGPIQGGLFAKEAYQSGNFQRIVLAEIDQQLVNAVRASHGTYHVNVATASGVETLRIDNVELLNLGDPGNATALQTALTEATEIATCLPSVEFYGTGGSNSIAASLAEASRTRKADSTIIYAAENNNHAAEILREAVENELDTNLPRRVQFLNTVIGKMSRVVTDPEEIAARNLAPIAPGLSRAFLVEEFNRILVSRASIGGFTPGIRVFIEKDDLLPFEEAKLYGHNAVHALLGFLGILRGYVSMTEFQNDDALMQIARDAFLKESGGALVAKYRALGDPLFTDAGYQHYADDLLERITNPHLADTVARAGRDALRKLGPTDRIFGTMSLALDYGIEPDNMALGALGGVAALLDGADEYHLPEDLRYPDWRSLDRDSLGRLLHWVWKDQEPQSSEELIRRTWQARESLAD
ncbi:MAG: mannitol dehydrogenase family protein [Planctomycetota bacterium]|jgi:mannitol-1-phosphate 5-dehydrogenase